MNIYVRIAVTAAVGYLVGLLAHLGWHVSPDLQDTVIGLLTGAGMAVVTAAVAQLEKWFPWLTRLFVSVVPANSSRAAVK